MDRKQKLQPWYHQIRKQCDVTTVAGFQCIFSGSYTDVRTGRLSLCKRHADLADFPVKMIREKRVTIR